MSRKDFKNKTNKMFNIFGRDRRAPQLGPKGHTGAVRLEKLEKAAPRASIF